MIFCIINKIMTVTIGYIKIRQNYLQAIDNIQQAPAEVVLESQTQTSSSLRYSLRYYNTIKFSFVHDIVSSV